MRPKTLTFRQFLTASRVARNALLAEENLWQRAKRGGACLYVRDRFAVTKPKLLFPSSLAFRATHRGIG